MIHRQTHSKKKNPNICAVNKLANRFLEVIPKVGVHNLCGKNYSHKELPENFSGKFGEIRAKIFRTPKTLPALTIPMGHRHC